jgi:SHS2 domain-containing protein
MEKFIFLEHTADMKFRSFGKTLEEAFENAALAMFEAMYKGKVKSKIKKKISVQGKDLERLLYNFLEELLFLMDSEGFFLGKINKIKIKQDKDYTILAEISGDDAKNYKINLDVKAITYNQMFVKQEKDNTGKNIWVCQVVVDV